MIFPSSHCLVSSPTDKRHLSLPFSGITNGKCDVSTKFVKSECGLMEVRGFIDAKNVSTTGTPLLCIALDVMGNRFALVSSHWPLLNRTNFFHPSCAIIQEKLPSGEPEKSLVSPEIQCRISAGFLSPPDWREEERGAHRRSHNHLSSVSVEFCKISSGFIPVMISCSI